jgi:hypothetical protein
MIDEALEKQIMVFIREQVRSLDYGKIQFTLTVQAHHATDLEGERIKTHIKLSRDNA